LPGYDDATFRPAENVTKVQAVVMISRLLGWERSKIDEAKTEHLALMNQVGVKTWYQDGIAVALEAGIISDETLRTFFDNGVEKVAKKDELTIYFTRAMGLEQAVKNKAIWILPFDDKELIPLQIQPYVHEMYDKKIVTGDTENKFNPNFPVNRATMATMLSRVYDYMEANNVVVAPVNDEKTVTVEGTISSILKASNEIYITIEDIRGLKTAYKVNSNTIVKIDDEKATSDDLLEGSNVEAEVTEDYRVISISIEGNDEDYSGIVKSVIISSPSTMTIEYKENNKTLTKSFYIDNNADISLNGEDAFVYEIKDGDMAELKIVNNRIVEIDAESKNKYIEGTIDNIIYNPNPQISIKDEDNNKYQLELSDDVDIKRNNKKAQLTDLRNGDKVEVEIEYNIITDIEAKVVKNDDEGTIRAILISTQPELTILNEDGDEVTYPISKDSVIEIDRDNASIYDLRLGYLVELEIEGNSIVAIDAESREQSDRYSGKIEYINQSANVIVISVPNSVTGSKETVRIDVTEDTTYIDTDGSSTRLKYLDQGDEIIAIGSFDGGIFTAKTILVTSRK